MEGNEIIEENKEFGLAPSLSFAVAVAINGMKKSKYVVRWALEKFVPEGSLMFKLLHVRPKITSVPSPMGNSIPLSRVRDDVAAAYLKEMGWQTSEMLLPYKKMLLHKKVKVQVDVVVIESDNAAKAIADEIMESRIHRLVIGASSSGMFSRKGKRLNLSVKISKCTPSFCTVYAVSKGKLSSVRPSDSEKLRDLVGFKFCKYYL